MGFWVEKNSQGRYPSQKVWRREGGGGPLALDAFNFFLLSRSLWAVRIALVHILCVFWYNKLTELGTFGYKGIALALRHAYERQKTDSLSFRWPRTLCHRQRAAICIGEAVRAPYQLTL